jgi:hypothetical protein
MMDEEKTVKIFILERAHEYLIPLIEEVFSANGIAFTVREKFDRAYDGMFIGQKGLGDLYVFEKDAGRAKTLLNELLKTENG